MCPPVRKAQKDLELILEDLKSFNEEIRALTKLYHADNM